MGIFKNIKDKKPTAGGVFYEAKKDGTPGHYLSGINAVKVVENWNNEEFIIIESEVHDSDVAERPKGTRPSVVLPVANPMSLSNFKGFVMAVLGLADEAALDEMCVEGKYVDKDGDASQEKFFEWLCGDDQPLAGQKFFLEAIATQTKKEKKPFTKLVYTHAEETATKLSDAAA